MGQHIFISYSDEDVQFAQVLEKRLRTNHFKPWVSKNAIRGGEHWQTELDKAIASSSHVLVLLSPASAASKYVEAEIMSALHHKKKVLPLLIKDCELPLLLRPFQLLDMRSRDGKNPSKSRALYSLLRRQGKLSDQSPTHTKRDVLLSLLDEQRHLLNQLTSVPNLLRARSSSRSSTIDLRSAAEWQETLFNEASKVKRAEAVIAVVGNLNSGKSTVINTIVGQDILPKDMFPMTSMPTMICNVFGQKIPVLHIPAPDLIVDFLGHLHSRLKEFEDSGSLEKIELYNQNKGGAAIRWLLNWKPDVDSIPRRYEGLSEIRDFLGNMNSWMRVAQDKNIKINSPIAQFTNADDIPRIDVEFLLSVRDGFEDQSVLAILDTPGLGEYGANPKLRQILRQQLARASAILAVVDIHSIKGAEAERVRRDISEIALGIEERLYIIVNKIDDTAVLDVNLGDLSKYVSQNVVPQALNMRPERVIPISALHAYLSRQALAALERMDRLPDPQVEAWVGAFGQEAFGKRWKGRIGDAEEVRDHARDLLSDSRFNIMMDTAIHPTAKQAAMISMKSALAKMQAYDLRVANFLKRRRSALTKTEAETKNQIAGLQLELNKVSQAITCLMNEIHGETEGMQRDVKILCQNKKKELSKGLKAELGDIKKSKFKSHSAAEKFWQKKWSIAMDEHDNAVANLQEIIRNRCSKIIDKMKTRTSDIYHATSEDARNYLEGQELVIQEMELPALSLAPETIDYLDVYTEEDEETTTRYAEEEGVLARGKRWLGGKVGRDDWGYKEIAVTKTRYVADPEEHVEMIVDKMNAQMEEIEKQAVIFTKKQLGKYINSMFSPLVSALSASEDDLVVGLENRPDNAKENDKIVELIDEVIGLFTSHLKRTSELAL